MLRTKHFFLLNNFTVEVEVTPYCNFLCSYCENKKNGSFENFSNYNIDFNQLYIFIINKFCNRKIKLLLNGGEPTLHPDLINFCKKISKHKNISIILYTNFSANKDLYKKILSYNIEIYPTFHEENYTIEQFNEKLLSLNIHNVLIPCTAINTANIEYIVSKLNNIKIQLILLENKEYLIADVNKLSKIDKNILQQYRILRKSGCNHRLCNSKEKYLYINGDGIVYQCMFLYNNKSIGNIKDNTLDIDKMQIRCTNSYCFYEF